MTLALYIRSISRYPFTLICNAQIELLSKMILRKALVGKMAPGKGLEPLRAKGPLACLSFNLGPLFSGYDLEASAITTPPPRHCPKDSKQRLLALSSKEILAIRLLVMHAFMAVRKSESGSCLCLMLFQVGYVH